MASICCHGRPKGVKRGKESMLVKNGKGRSRIVKEVKGLVKGDVTGGIQVPQVGTNCTMWNQVGEMYQMGSSGIRLLQVGSCI